MKCLLTVLPAQLPACTRRATATLVLSALLGLLGSGCGSDGPNVPSDEVDVTGTYNLGFMDLNDGVHQCRSDVQTVLVLAQRGSTVTGTYSGGRIYCDDLPSVPVSDGGGALMHVSYTSGHLTFELGDPGWRVEATAVLRSFSGQSTVTISVQGVPTVFTGRAVAGQSG
jgi:hypothetical protein